MENIIQANKKIEALQKEIKFIESNLKYLDDNNIKYLLVNHGKKYSCMIKIDQNLSLINDIVDQYKPSTNIKNNIGSASGQTWKNKSPFLIKCNPFNNEYLHLNHYVNVTYKVKEDFEINIEVNIKLLDNLHLFSQATKETEHFKNDRDKEYETIVMLNESNISKVKFYGNQFYYYAGNTLEVKTIKDILQIK